MLFTLGSAACGLSTTLPELIVFRVLQGVGGGMLMPVVMIIMAQIAGPQRMGRVMAIVSMPMMLAPILGPVVGGVILQNLHWSWIFFVNVPIGIVAFVLGMRHRPAPRLRRGRPSRRARPRALPDWARRDHLRCLANWARARHSARCSVLAAAIAGLALVLAFCLHALRVERPLLDIRLYANRVFAGASLTTFFVGAALFGAMILVPLYYQRSAARASSRPAC